MKEEATEQKRRNDRGVYKLDAPRNIDVKGDTLTD